MTTKTKLSIFILSGIVAIVATMSGLMLSYNDSTTNTTTALEPTEELVVEKISDTPRPSDTMRVGVQFLAIDPRNEEPDKYHEVKVDRYAWIQRLLTDGETIVNEKELEEYFSIVDSDNNPKFGVTMHDGTVEYYTISFYEVQNFDLDRHYIKVYPLYDQSTKNLRHLEQEDSSWMTELSKDRFRWVLVDDAIYDKYKNATLEGKQFNIMTAKGIFENVELRYAGADSTVKPSFAHESEEIEK